MEELIKTFHIDWKLMIAQLINFAIVLFVLWRFALKPLLKVMNKRSSEIEKSLENAKKVDEKLREADKLKEERILEARKESQLILEKTSKEAEAIQQEKLVETKNEMEKIASRTKAELAAEKQKMFEEAKGKIGDLVIAASGKIIEKELDEKTDRKLIEETIKQVK